MRGASFERIRILDGLPEILAVPSRMYWTNSTALEQCRNSILKSYLHRSPEALVFFDRRGALLYETARGEVQFKLWNRALIGRQEAFSLPGALNFDLSPQVASQTLQHPNLSGLTAIFEGIDEGFILRLIEDQVSETAEELSERALANLQKLSRSEQRVARLAVKGLRNDQIAARICRSTRTVEGQLNSTFRKLGVRNRVQLFRVLD